MSAAPPELARQRAHEIADALGGARKVTVTRFFGGAALVAHGTQFAFVIKGTLYLRTDASSRARFEARGCAPFSYATRRGRVVVASYHEAPPDVVDDPAQLREWVAAAQRSAARANAC